MSSFQGFGNINNHVNRKAVKRGFEFTLMVVGESGLGKSTLVNSLFLTDIYSTRNTLSAKARIDSTMEIETSCVDIEERGIKLKLTVVDTPGFADGIDSSNCFLPIVKYVEHQFENYLRDESGLNRKNISDTRVHCCFYFINPSGHGMRPIDVQFLRLLHDRVNIVPVIGKADTLTPQELFSLKEKVLGELHEHRINIYDVPYCDDDEEDDFKSLTKELKVAIPYAVIGSNTFFTVDGKKVRGRCYPWGVVNIEDPHHCDFIKLRTMLVTFMQDLKDVTQDFHYENYRAQRLAQPQPMCEEVETRKHSSVETPPTATTSRASPSMINEKDQMLKEKELELKLMQEQIERMQAQMKLNNPS